MITTHEEFFNFINQCISSENENRGVLQDCNNLEFKVINFNKNFTFLTTQSIKVLNISYNNVGFSDNWGFFTLGSNNGLCTRCIFYNAGLLVKKDPSEVGLRLFYNSINKEITFKYINTLYKDYFTDLIKELGELRDNHTKVLDYIKNDKYDNNN